MVAYNPDIKNKAFALKMLTISERGSVISTPMYCSRKNAIFQETRAFQEQVIRRPNKSELDREEGKGL